MPDINARRIGLSLGSVCLHLAVLGLFWQEAPFANGTARKNDGFGLTSPVLTIGFVSGERAQPFSSSTQPANAIFSVDREISIEKAPASLISHVHDFSIETKEKALLSEPSLETIAAPDYFPAGRLTRLPVPLVDIDLDIPEIKEAAFSGQMELSVLIDENGIVIDVLGAIETDMVRTFSDLVTERFKNARFVPGEIDGKAVKSQLQITVVSENLSAMGN